MKKVFRKSMFVLSFMGLFTFAAPKQAKAEQNKYPYWTWICCPDGNCHLCYIQRPGDEAIYQSFCGEIVTPTPSDL